MILIASAGHIDHGKTSLIHALTGVATDRLPEEKARGMSIDLGFAYMAAPFGDTLGFVDVPGHEKFIRTMLSGAGAVDLGLLVVAADDGIMPQTLEHLDSLDLLGVQQLVVALNKSDLADEGLLTRRQEEIAALLAPTRFAGSAILITSTKSGVGLDGLKHEILALAEPLSHRPASDQDAQFRLAIDKAFSIPGRGTVVSGTIRSGAVTTGDKLVLFPSGKEIRLRGMQSAGQPATAAGSGARVALNLSGIDLREVKRGDWVIAPDQFAPSLRLAVDLRMLSRSDRVLQHNSQVHLHLGTDDLPCRVLLDGHGTLAAGERRPAYLIPARAVQACCGDRFVIRSADGKRTLGGGIVTDPFTPRRRRKGTMTPIERVAALNIADPVAAFRALLTDQPNGLEIAPFQQARNLTTGAMETILTHVAPLRFGKSSGWALDPTYPDRLAPDLLAEIDQYHAAHPDLTGPVQSRLIEGLPVRFSREAGRAVMADFVARGLLKIKGAFVHRANHQPSEDASAVSAWDRLLSAATVFEHSASFGIVDLAHATGMERRDVSALLFARRGSGEIRRISRTRYMHDAAFRSLSEQIQSVAQAAGGAGFTVSQARDATGVGRNSLIELLDHYDRSGLSRRDGDHRHLVKGFADRIDDCAREELRLLPKDFEPPRRKRR